MTEYLALINRFAAARRDRRNGLRLFLLGDRPPGRVCRCRDRRAGRPDAGAGAGGQMRLARAHRRHAGRNLSRPRSRRRVLGGRIGRGAAERIDAVLWYSDLRAFTRITDTAPPRNIIPLLNDYAEAVISAVHDHGGDVLKLIGDGCWRSSPRETARPPGRRDAAESALRRRLGELNARRGGPGCRRPRSISAMHIGEVFYGNIGSQRRLDFTVIGPAVNEVARIAAMCRSAERRRVAVGRFRRGRAAASAGAGGLGRALCVARRRAAAGTVHARPPAGQSATDPRPPAPRPRTHW